VSEHYDVLIVGGGHGGAAAAMALRHNGFTGSIAIAGAEPDLPYDRPPLSKDYLLGEKPFQRMVFRSAEAWAERGVELMLGTIVAEIDPVARHVVKDGGGAIGYGKLIWAAGGVPHKLRCAGSGLGGVYLIRTRADVDRLTSELRRAQRAVVVGGGYIGLEAAAALVKLGKQVTLVEAQDRVLSRVAGEPLSRFFEAEHRSRGVDVRLQAAVAAIEGTEEVTGVRLASGETLPADMVIVGIGIGAAWAPLEQAGADGGNGVRVDAQCRTSLPNVFAIGDCAEHRNRFAGGEWVRLESVQNATDQAAVAAKTICGLTAEYDAVPWFWSNQFDLKLQTVGLSQRHDEIVTRGDPAGRSFSLVYLAQGRVIALDCVNAARDFVQGKGLVASGAAPDRGALADPAVPLKSLVEARTGAPRSPERTRLS
jgi:3-phenylpropionate/trans-cinnamate dioxygenase ferredoxin reductase subunit